MAWWQRLPRRTKESIAKQEAVGEVMAKAYESQLDRFAANNKAHAETEEAKAFAKAEAEALEKAKDEAEKEKTKAKSKSKGKAKAKAKAKAKVKPKAKAKLTDAQKIRKLKAVVKSLTFDLRLASDDRKAKEIRRLNGTLRRVREQLQAAKAKNDEAAVQLSGAEAIIKMLRAGKINC